MDKIKRATEIHRAMTPNQMALYIVEIDEFCANAAKRITELQDALELAEEAVRAKQQAVPEGWQLAPVDPTVSMLAAFVEADGEAIRGYKAMLASAPRYKGGAA